MDNLKLISKIALSFQDLNNFDSEMNKILEDIGSAIDVSRIYVFLNEKEVKTPYVGILIWYLKTMLLNFCAM